MSKSEHIGVPLRQVIPQSSRRLHNLSSRDAASIADVYAKGGKIKFRDQEERNIVLGQVFTKPKSSRRTN
jgi:hypothetical protein